MMPIVLVTAQQFRVKDGDASVPPTQAAFTNSHHGVLDADDLSQATVQLCEDFSY